MAKRIKIDKFVEFLSNNGLAGKEKRKSGIKEFADSYDLIVPVSFWKTYGIVGKRGYYGIPKGASIESESEVNVDISAEIPDEEFSLEVGDIGILVQSITVTDLISGESATTSISSPASQQSIDNVYNYYKRKLRHLH